MKKIKNYDLSANVKYMRFPQREIENEEKAYNGYRGYVPDGDRYIRIKQDMIVVENVTAKNSNRPNS